MPPFGGGAGADVSSGGLAALGGGVAAAGTSRDPSGVGSKRLGCQVASSDSIFYKAQSGPPGVAGAVALGHPGEVDALAQGGGSACSRGAGISRHPVAKTVRHISPQRTQEGQPQFSEDSVAEVVAIPSQHAHEGPGHDVVAIAEGTAGMNDRVDGGCAPHPGLGGEIPRIEIHSASSDCLRIVTAPLGDSRGSPEEVYKSQVSDGGHADRGNACNDKILLNARPGDSYFAARGRGVDKVVCKPFDGSPARTKVIHVTGEHPDFCLNGMRVLTLECPLGRNLACQVKEVVRTMGGDTLQRQGVSNVLLVRGSLLAGRRGESIGKVVWDMVSYWLKGRWPLVVYLSNTRVLAHGVSERFGEFGCPSVLCCSCSLGLPGDHKLGAIHHSIFDLKPVIQACVNCHESRVAVDEAWGWQTSQWLITNLRSVHRSLSRSSTIVKSSSIKVTSDPSIQPLMPQIKSNQSSNRISNRRLVSGNYVAQLPARPGSYEATSVAMAEAEWHGGADTSISVARQTPMSARLAQDQPKEEEPSHAEGVSHARSQLLASRGSMRGPTHAANSCASVGNRCRPKRGNGRTISRCFGRPGGQSAPAEGRRLA